MAEPFRGRHMIRENARVSGHTRSPDMAIAAAAEAS
jgi:hypothetical protein